MNRTLAGLIILAILTGCERRRSEAIVLEKEHIAVLASTPTPAPSDHQSVTEEGSPLDAAGVETEPALRKMAPDEIVVDGVVMKAALRGTEHDPRASAHEQWIVKVRTTDGGRTFNVYTDRADYGKINIGDRVKVSYRVGKYTGTVWATELE